MLSRLGKWFSRSSRTSKTSSSILLKQEKAPDAFKLGDDESLYEALDKCGLLVGLRFPSRYLGFHLVQDGELGLSLNNGKPRFLAPGGRHTLWSVLNKFRGTVPITQKLISLGSIQIVTIDQGELGLAMKNGVNRILEPGRYILHAPNQFVKSVSANQQYIELGTHRRITVPAGFVAVAYDKGKQIIITPESTKKGPYITDSPSFLFDPKTGFKSTQIEDVTLEKFTVNTRETINLSVVGLIQYRIVDSFKAFFNVDDVHASIKRQAKATLTSVFAQLSIDQVSSSVSSTNVSSYKGEKAEKQIEEIPNDFIHRATNLFIEKFRQIVAQWGVELNSLNISSMEFTDESFREALRTRAQKRMEADTNLINLQATNEVALKEAERKRQQQIIAAQGEAEAMKIAAQARLYAAEQDAKASERLASVPLAAHLAVLKGQAEVASKMGNNTVFMGHDLSLGGLGVRGTQGQMLWVTANEGSNSQSATNTAVQNTDNVISIENRH